MSEAFTPVDATVAAVLEACRERFLLAVRPAFDVEFLALQREGYGAALVSTALIGSCTQLLFEAIYSNVQAVHRLSVAEDAAARLVQHVQTVGDVDHLDGVPPAGVTLQ